ncbi:MAG: hypothetical protein ABI921_03140 [Panacibacter sp.]
MINKYLRWMKTGLLQEMFELVKSLSKTEKRYFKLYTQFQQGDKSYIKLFDIIDKQVSFNEKIINQKFLSKNKVTNFPAIKKYLFNQLVASIKSYGAYKDLDSDHSDLIETYKVLRYKGLYGQSDRLLKKIKQLTLEDDAFLRHYSALILEYYKEMYDPDDTSSANIIRILKEFRSTMDVMDNYSKVAETFILVRLHLKTKLYCRNDKDKEELTKIACNLLKTTDSDMLSRTALSMRKLTLCDYYLAVGEPAKAFETSKIHLELRKNVGSNDKLDTLTLNEYFQHSVICLRSGFFEGFEENIQHYKLLIDTVRNKEKYFLFYERWHNSVFMYYNRTGQFAEGAAFLKKEQAKNADLEKNFSMKAKITLWYFTAYNCFALKDYKRALKLIQNIMNDADDTVEESSFAKLLLMFVHYHLNNYELLEYQARSADRMMKKTDHLYNCEKLLLDFFKIVSGLVDASQLDMQLKALQKKVNILFKVHYERGFSFYFDIQSWIESQLTGKGFAQVVRRVNSCIAENV